MREEGRRKEVDGEIEVVEEEGGRRRDGIEGEKGEVGEDGRKMRDGGCECE